LTADDRERRACKTVIDADRLALAAERGYTVSHFMMRPFGITPNLYGTLCSCNSNMPVPKKAKKTR
jgi:hypothetical protein